jgi:hypothetical protein
VALGARLATKQAQHSPEDSGARVSALTELLRQAHLDLARERGLREESDARANRAEKTAREALEKAAEYVGWETYGSYPG